MTGGGRLQQDPPPRAAPDASSTNHAAQFDSLRQYIAAKEVAHKRLGGDSLKRSNSSGTCNADERRADTPTVTIEGGTSQSAANSPRGSSASPTAAAASSAMSGRVSVCGSSSSSTAGASPGAPGGQEYILKVVLIGDSGVGKSNLVSRFTKNKYQPKSVQTVGFEFATKMIRVGDRRIKAQIWDTAGQERFQSLTAAYYRNAVGAMIVYDITNRSSFERVTSWLAQVHAHAHESLVLLLVGNKCDLAHLPQSRQVSTLEAARFAAKHSMEFLEASALDATNVVDAFKKLIVPVGRLLSPTHPHATNIARLPPGWRRVLSRTRPGEYSYENQYTKERIAFAPKEPAKPSQQSFRPLVASATSSSGASASAVGTSGGASGNGLAGTRGGAITVTVTRESLQLQHQKAFLAQNHSPPCGVCTPAAACTIL